MKHFKNTQNQVIALEEDGSQDFLIAQIGLTPITDEEKDTLLAGPVPTLSELKTAKNLEINAARLAANRTKFTYAGKDIACDELSRGDIDGANGAINNLGALPPGWPGAWKAIDNTYVTIATVNDWKNFYLSMFAAGNANFVHAQTLKTALAAATTKEEVDAIIW